MEIGVLLKFTGVKLKIKSHIRDVIRFK